MIALQLQRRATNAAADALFERFQIWPLGGPSISIPAKVPRIDDRKYPTLGQFAIIMSFFERIKIIYGQDAKEQMRVWGNQMRDDSRLH